MSATSRQVTVGYAAVMLVFLSACTREADSRRSRALPPDSARAERRMVVTRWDTLWRVGGESDTVLLRPFLLAASDEGVFVYDGGSRRVTAFAPGGVVRWRFGRAGHGPDEFEKVRDLRIGQDGGVDVLDPANNRILRLRGDGSVRGRVPLSAVGHAEQMVVAAPDQIVLLTYQQDSSFAVIDTAGQVRSRFTLPWRGFERLGVIARQGVLAAADGRWVFAFSFGDGWFPYRGLRPDSFVGRFVEHTEFPGVRTVETANGRGTKMEEYNACSACSVSMSGRTLYVSFGGYSPQAQRVVDLYGVGNGTYRGSWVLPKPAVALAVWGERVYILAEDPYPELLALRAKREGS
jgi:hypothetical protein